MFTQMCIALLVCTMDKKTNVASRSLCIKGQSENLSDYIDRLTEYQDNPALKDCQSINNKIQTSEDNKSKTAKTNNRQSTISMVLIGVSVFILMLLVAGGIIYRCYTMKNETKIVRTRLLSLVNTNYIEDEIYVRQNRKTGYGNMPRMLSSIKNTDNWGCEEYALTPQRSMRSARKRRILDDNTK